MQADLYNGRKMVVHVVAELSSTKDAFTTTVYTLQATCTAFPVGQGTGILPVLVMYEYQNPQLILKLTLNLTPLTLTGRHTA